MSSINKGGVFESMSKAPSATEYGEGPAWIGGVLYWSDGNKFNKKAGGEYSLINGYQEGFFEFKSAGPESWTDFVSGSGTHTETKSTTKFATGTSSLSVSLTGTSSTIKARKRNVSWDFTSSPSNTYIGLRLYRDKCPDANNPHWVYVSNDANLLANVAIAYPPTTTHYQQGWSTVPIYKGISGAPLYMTKFSNVAGNIDFGTNILGCSAQWQTFGGYTSEMVFDSLFHGLYERPKISISFDDCYSSAYRIGHEECIRRGMKSTQFGMFRVLGTGAFMSAEQLKALALHPLVEVGLHSDKRFDGAGSGAGTVPATEIAENIAGLAALNIPMVPYGAWPEGQYAPSDPSVALVPIRNAGIKGMRSTYRAYSIFNSGCYNPYSIGSVDLSNAHTVAQIKEIIDACIAYGMSMCFNGHQIADSGVPNSSTYVKADYVEILDYIADKRSKGLLDVVFFSEMIESNPTAPLVSF